MVMSTKQAATTQHRLIYRDILGQLFDFSCQKIFKTSTYFFLHVAATVPKNRDDQTADHIASPAPCRCINPAMSYETKPVKVCLLSGCLPAWVMTRQIPDRGWAPPKRRIMQLRYYHSASWRRQITNQMFRVKILRNISRYCVRR